MGVLIQKSDCYFH